MTKKKVVRKSVSKKYNVVEEFNTLKNDAQRNDFIEGCIAHPKSDDHKKLSAFLLRKYKNAVLTNGVAVIDDVITKDNSTVLSINVNGVSKLVETSPKVIAYHDKIPVFSVNGKVPPTKKNDPFELYATTFFGAKPFYGHKVKKFDKDENRGHVFIHEVSHGKYVLRSYYKIQQDMYVIVGNTAENDNKVVNASFMRRLYVINHLENFYSRFPQQIGRR